MNEHSIHFGSSKLKAKWPENIIVSRHKWSPERTFPHNRRGKRAHSQENTLRWKKENERNTTEHTSSSADQHMCVVCIQQTDQTYTPNRTDITYERGDWVQTKSLSSCCQIHSMKVLTECRLSRRADGKQICNSFYREIPGEEHVSSCGPQQWGKLSAALEPTSRIKTLPKLEGLVDG